MPEKGDGTASAHHHTETAPPTPNDPNVKQGYLVKKGKMRVHAKWVVCVNERKREREREQSREEREREEKEKESERGQEGRREGERKTTDSADKRD